MNTMIALTTLRTIILKLLVIFPKLEGAYHQREYTLAFVLYLECLIAVSPELLLVLGVP